MRNLGKAVERKLGVKVQVIQAAGSLESLLYLRDRKADFGLYQSGSLELVEELDPDALNELGIASRSVDTEMISFAANLDTQPANLIVRRDAGINSPADLRGKIVNLGLKRGGTYAMSLVLLKHLGLTKDSVRAKYLNYKEVKEAFLEGSLDAAFTTVGIQSPTFRELFETGRCSLLSVPHAEALARNYVGMWQFTIPAGFYRSHPPAEPATDVQTVALRVQLLTRRDVNDRLVEEVTRIALSEDFMKKNNLAELFARGHRFAREVSDFAIHPGALRYYEPEPHPLLPPDFVQATEGIRSFLFSIALSAYFVYRGSKGKESIAWTSTSKGFSPSNRSNPVSIPKRNNLSWLRSQTLTPRRPCLASWSVSIP
jgi:TRAP transporter TAXI family solute receptor